MWKRLGVLLVVVAVIAAFYITGVIDRVSDQEKLSALLTQSGASGPAVFVALFALLEGLGVPGFLFILTAALVWPFWPAFLLSLAGAVGAGIVGFIVARYLGRDFLERHLPSQARRYDEQLAARGFQTVLVIRLLFFISPWAHWLLGLSRVRFVPFLAGTIIGLTPGMMLATFAARHGAQWLFEQEVEAVVGTAVFIAAAIAAIHWWRRRTAAERS